MTVYSPRLHWSGLLRVKKNEWKSMTGSIFYFSYRRAVNTLYVVKFVKY